MVLDPESFAAHCQAGARTHADVGFSGAQIAHRAAQLMEVSTSTPERAPWQAVARGRNLAPAWRRGRVGRQQVIAGGDGSQAAGKYEPDEEGKRRSIADFAQARFVLRFH